MSSPAGGPPSPAPGRSPAGVLWRSVTRARDACRHGLVIRLEGESVSFWSDLPQGVHIARTVFGPYCTVADVPAPDGWRSGRWRVASAEVADLHAIVEGLEQEARAGGRPAVPVRRWGGDVPADRYDVGPGRWVVVHRRLFAGLTVFLRDEREVYYLRPDAGFDVPHTEHTIKYPLRVALRRCGFCQVHAAACRFRGRGLLLMGQRRSGKSTLLMHLMSRGARFIANDLTFVRRIRGGGRMIAFPHMTRMALGTIGDNDALRDSLSRPDRTGDYLRSSVLNGEKEEFYYPVFERIWGSDAICRGSPLDVILFPALDLGRTRASSTPLPRDEVERRIRDTLMNDPPILDWLPFMSDADFHSLLSASAEDVVRCAPAGHEVRFGPSLTDPASAVERILGSIAGPEP